MNVVLFPRGIALEGLRRHEYPGLAERVPACVQAKVVGPVGDILARTWSKAGLAVAQVDLEAEIARARRVGP